MRPDEHKKKNSARYKKKHGQQSSSNIAAASTAKPKDKRSSTEKFIKSEVDSSRNELLQSQIEQEESQHRNFSRRIIKSNWEKYEESEESVQHIGTDFNELILSAGGVSSHMKLESEKDWETEQAPDDLLTVDVQRIADVLGELSFCERLGLDEHQFDPTLLSMMKGDKSIIADATPTTFGTYAIHNYDLDFQVPQSSKISDDGNHAKTNKSHNFKSDDITTSIPLKKNSSSKQNLSEECDSLSPTVLDSKPCHDSNLSLLAEEKQSEDIKSRNNSSLDTSDLSVPGNTTQLKSSKPENAVISSSTQSAVDDLESELDALLSGDTQVKSVQSPAKKTDSSALTFQKSSTHSSATVDDTKVEHEDLEDWLDSII